MPLSVRNAHGRNSPGGFGRHADMLGQKVIGRAVLHFDPDGFEPDSRSKFGQTRGAAVNGGATKNAALPVMTRENVSVAVAAMRQAGRDKTVDRMAV
jgi:hypothetical protein